MDKKELTEQLEYELNHFQYSGIKCGSLLAQFIFQSVYKNQEDLTNKSKTARAIFVTIKLFLKNIFTIVKKKSISNRIIITKVSNNDHINKLMDPLIEHWKENSIVITNGNITCAREEIDQKQLLYAPFFANILLTIHWLIMAYQLLKITLKNKLPFGFWIQASSQLYIQFIRVAYWESQIKDSTLRAVITEYDRYHYVIPIILVAKKYNIPTITLTHGAFSSKLGFLPLLADKILVWGETQQKILLNNKLDADKIIIAGCPIISPVQKNKNIELLFSNVKLDSQKITVVFIINPISNTFNIQLLDVFSEGVKKHKNMQGVVKLHPSQSKNRMSEMLQRYPELTWLESKEISNPDLFLITDFLFTHNSGMGVEALFNNVPVAILNNIDAYLGIGRELIDLADCPEIRTEEDLEQVLKNIETDKDIYTKNILKNAASYLNRIYYKTGKDASYETIKIITSIINEK
jgi:hypothetical protein